MKKIKETLKELIVLFIDFKPKDLEEVKRTQKILKGLKILTSLHTKNITFDRDICVTYSLLRRKIHQDHWENWIVRRVLYNFHIWQSSDSATNHIYLDLLNYVKSVLCVSLIPENYPLHRAVFEKNLCKIRQICIGEDSTYFHINIDEPDCIGNTALMLAVKLGFSDEVQVLIDHGANPKHRISFSAASPIEQAIAMGDKNILAKLVSGYHRELHNNWNEHVEEFGQTLKQMPDFSLNMNWECTSKFIPFIRKFTPSDKYRIYKKGNNLKIDLSLMGWEQFRAKRGKLSLMFFGNLSKVVLVDHTNNTSRDLFTELSFDQVQKHTEVTFI